MSLIYVETRDEYPPGPIRRLVKNHLVFCGADALKYGDDENSVYGPDFRGWGLLLFDEIHKVERLISFRDTRHMSLTVGPVLRGRFSGAHEFEHTGLS